MATIDDTKAIADLLKNDGHFMEDPQPAMIIKYFNPNSTKPLAAVLYASEALGAEVIELLKSPFVEDPNVLWTIDKGLTPVGRQWIDNYE
ncbi:MAG TPA: hypothetical protein VGF16_16660 [Bryobacteraceae bacterium]|jgi:hypothetical protein